ncbi:MAG: hypothetical protein KDB14_17660 [Planctomycetales bacterium]|nr:hypothetical protein [Planctomycetales bacterium]
MLTSDAVDRSIAQMDLSALTGKKVYLDTQFIRNIKGAGFVNADYITSSLRQQLFAYGCRLQEKESDAEVVVEGRVGVLGIDDHEITYGMPASNALSSAASATGAQIPLPALPELSVAKKNEQVGAAKVAMFAYDRESREVIWQSGVTTSMSDSDAFWVFGAGPFRRGTIYNGMQFAGSRVRIPKLIRSNQQIGSPQEIALANYQEAWDYTIQPPASVRTPSTNDLVQPSEGAAEASLSDEPKLLPEDGHDPALVAADAADKPAPAAGPQPQTPAPTPETEPKPASKPEPQSVPKPNPAPAESPPAEAAPSAPQTAAARPPVGAKPDVP